VKLTVIDTPGFGDYVNNRDSWTPIVDFIDDQHEAYMRMEQQPQREQKTDLRVHACLYFIRPTGQTYVAYGSRRKKRTLTETAVSSRSTLRS
jgi:cell division control protein 12